MNAHRISIYGRLPSHAAWVVPLALLLLWAGGCGGKDPGPAATQGGVPVEPSRVIGLGRIEPELRILDLASEVTGLVATIKARPGDALSQGQPILGLSQAIEQAKVEQSEAKVETQASEVESSKAALASVRIKAANAKVAFNRAKTLFEQDTQAKVIFDNAKADYEAFLQDIRRLEASVLSAQNQLKQSQADLRYSRAVLDQRSIKAPADGTLLTLDVSVGSLVSAGVPFGTFAPRSPLVARCEVDEMFADRVQTGQEALIRFLGSTEVKSRGTVTFVGPALRKKSLLADDVGELEDRRVREVWITLPAGSGLLYGTRVECVIPLAEGAR